MWPKEHHFLAGPKVATPSPGARYMRAAVQPYYRLMRLAFGFYPENTQLKARENMCIPGKKPLACSARLAAAHSSVISFNQSNT